MYFAKKMAVAFFKAFESVFENWGKMKVSGGLQQCSHEEFYLQRSICLLFDMIRYFYKKYLEKIKKNKVFLEFTVSSDQ